MKKDDLEKLEIKLLTDGIFEVYGFDFRRYAMASFRRRIEQFVSNNNYESITHLLAGILHDRSLMVNFVKSVSVTTSEMFRDPHIFLYIREHVIPYLKTFPHIRIWHAACANGEEVFSLAIMLKEEGIYDRCSIYATDMNDEAIQNVQKGIFPVKMLREYSLNYQKSGGKSTLSDYYHAKYDYAIFNSELLKNVTFANHNLAVDSVFMETHFILCRNVMIYFNRDLQNKVLNLFDDSLVNGGILCLGSKETIQFSSVENKYKELQENCRVFRKDTYAAEKN